MENFHDTLHQAEERHKDPKDQLKLIQSEEEKKRKKKGKRKKEVKKC